MPWGLAIATMLAAVANWYSRRPGSDDDPNSPWLEWLTKPLVPVGMVAMADAVAEVGVDQLQWFLLGLAFCLAGDVALMWRPEMFRAGLALFLMAHVSFVVVFVARSDRAPTWSIAVGAMVLVGCLTVGARHLLPSVRRNAPALLGPVLLYMIVIAAMAVTSWWGGHWAAPVGTATFAVSDLILADNKFVAERPWSPMIVMITYHGALALLVLSLT